jgi:tetratricopeptide (TPR) repeat protein
VLASDANLAEALAHYSQALISEATLGGAEASLRHFRQAAQEDPSYLPLSLTVAAGYLARREFDQALMILDRARQTHPDSADLRLLLGIVYQIKQLPREAAREYRAAIRAAPERSDAYVRLATLYASEDRFGKAFAAIDAGFKAAQDPAGLVELCDSMGRLYFAGGRPKDALPFLLRIEDRLPDNLLIKEMIARCQVALGKNRQAIAGLEALQKARPDSPAISLLLGDLYETEGDAARAEEALARAAKLPAEDATAELRLAMLQLKRDRAKAVETLLTAVKEHPTDLSVRAFLGLLYSYQKRYADAIREFEAIEEQAEKDPVAARRLLPQFYFWYGSVCEQAGRMTDAERLMERCVALDPEFAQALNYLAYVWAEKGDNLDKALDYVTRALKLQPKEGAFLDTLGWVYYKKGAFREALDYLQQALDAESDPVIADHVGDAWLALNEPRKAERFWRLSLKLDPHKAAVREKLIKAGVAAESLPPAPPAAK